MEFKKNIAAFIAAGAIGVGSAFIVSSDPASAGRSLGRASSDGVQITHGDFQRLADGGFGFSVCGFTINTEDGGKANVENTCAPCVSSWREAPRTCVEAWKKANSLPPSEK